MNLDVQKVLLQRVRIDPATECWLWRGSVNACGVPTRDGHSVRREFYETFVGEVPPRRFVVCGECPDRSRCVSPYHASLMTKTEYMRAAKKRGTSFSSAAKSAKVQVARRRASHLTIESVREIRQRRERGETLQSLANAFSTTDKNIFNIAAGKTWRDLSSNPLAQSLQLAGMLP